LNLYALDAVSLATAICKKVHLITEGQLLLKRSAIEYAKKNKVKIYNLEKSPKSKLVEMILNLKLRIKWRKC